MEFVGIDKSAATRSADGTILDAQCAGDVHVVGDITSVLVRIMNIPS